MEDDEAQRRAARAQDSLPMPVANSARVWSRSSTGGSRNNGRRSRSTHVAPGLGPPAEEIARAEALPGDLP